MGGGSLPPVPDWRTYKVEGIPKLEWTRDELAKKGLKDPWLRNEVWRYQQWPGMAGAARIQFGRGLKLALAAMAVTIIVDKAFGISESRKHGHGHGDDHH